MYEETKMWSNYFWDNADDASRKRVLLVGDSIAFQNHPFVCPMLQNTYNVDVFATARRVGESLFEKELAHALSLYPYHIIMFNNGLHALWMQDAEYQTGLQSMLCVIQKNAPKAHLIFATSTALEDEKANQIVVRRNEIAKEMMQKNNVPVHDLYALTYQKTGIRMPSDMYHFNDEGKKILANSIKEKVLTF